MSSRVAENLATIKPGTLFAGVDVARDEHVVTVSTERAQRVARFKVAHTREGFDVFFQRLEELRSKHNAPEVLIGMEPSGNLWMPLAEAAAARDRRYVLVNAYTVHQRRAGDALDSSKDDWRDSATVSELMRTGVFTQTQLQRSPFAELRILEERLETVGREIARHKNRLRADLAVVFPEFRTVFKDVLGLTAQAVLEYDALPAHITQTEEAVWLAGVRRVFRGKKLGLRQLARLREMAATSIGCRAGAKARQRTMRSTLKILRLLREEQRELRRVMREQTLQVPGYARALEIQGLSLLTVGRILGQIGDPTRFDKGRQLVKLAGIQPTPDASGQHRRSRTPMANKGRAGLRTILYFATLRVIHADESFRQAYERLQTREKNPLCKMEAIGALMNKLLRVIWTLIVQDVAYDPQRAFAS